jgi:N-acetylneuraminic acid mutarotase
MKVKLYYLLIPLLAAVQCSWAQSMKWEKVGPAKTSESQTQTEFQEMFEDKDFSLGGENVPSPRFGAASWQTGEGQWVMFSGVGFDAGGNWGLLDDTWQYTASDNSWTLLAGQRKVGTQKWEDQTDLPIPRRNAVSWSDNKGNLYLMGGTQLNDSEYFYDLWKYSVKGGGWMRVSAKTTANQSAVWGQKKKR